MENVAESIKAYRKHVRELKGTPIRYTIMTLVNAWNWATSPSIPRTDREHSACRTFARQCMKSLKSPNMANKWKEFDSGRLWYSF